MNDDDLNKKIEDEVTKRLEKKERMDTYKKQMIKENDNLLESVRTFIIGLIFVWIIIEFHPTLHFILDDEPMKALSVEETPSVLWDIFGFITVIMILVGFFDFIFKVWSYKGESFLPKALQGILFLTVFLGVVYWIIKSLFF